MLAILTAKFRQTPSYEHRNHSQRLSNTVTVRSTSVTTILQNRPTWTKAGFAVMPFGINILKVKSFFSVKTQLCCLTNQLHVSATVFCHHQADPKNIKGSK